MTEVKASNGKLYVSAIFDCFDLSVTGLAMDTDQKAPLCVQTLENTYKAYPALRGAAIHSDRGTQASFTGLPSADMGSGRVWTTAQAHAATIMPAAKVCGQG